MPKGPTLRTTLVLIFTHMGQVAKQEQILLPKETPTAEQLNPNLGFSI